MIKSIFPNIPIITNLPFGHTLPNVTIPLGAECKIDFNQGKIDFLFSEKDKDYAVRF